MTPNTVSTLSPAALAVLRYLALPEHRPLDRAALQRSLRITQRQADDAVNELERCGCIEPRRVRLTEYGRSLAEMSEEARINQ